MLSLSVGCCSSPIFWRWNLANYVLTECRVLCRIWCNTGVNPSRHFESTFSPCCTIYLFLLFFMSYYLQKLSFYSYSLIPACLFYQFMVFMAQRMVLFWAVYCIAAHYDRSSCSCCRSSWQETITPWGGFWNGTSLVLACDLGNVLLPSSCPVCY